MRSRSTRQPMAPRSSVCITCVTTISFGPSPKAAPNDIWRMPNISTPQLSEESGYVTPNVNTIYGFGFLDLGPQPIILTLPDSKGLYYMVEVCDMWTNVFAYPAGAVNGYKGGKFALVGPGWKGTLPDGIQRIDSPTRWVLIQPRVHLKNQGDLATSRAVLNGITTQGLAQFLGQQPPATPAYNYAVPVVTDKRQSASALNFADPAQFWEIFSAAMNEIRRLRVKSPRCFRCSNLSVSNWESSGAPLWWTRSPLPP